MSQVLTEPQLSPYVTLHLSPAIEFSDDEFFELCQINRDLRFERTAEGDIIIMAPAGGETGTRNAEITAQLRNWAKGGDQGVAFDSSTGFKLPNGADRSPDAAWVSRSRLVTLSQKEKQKFLPLCPDFVIELLSPTDRLDIVKEKMQEYIENGSRLGWLIDPGARQVYIYRPNTAPAVIGDISEIAANPELPDFVLDLREIWQPNL